MGCQQTLLSVRASEPSEALISQAIQRCGAFSSWKRICKAIRREDSSAHCSDQPALRLGRHPVERFRYGCNHSQYGQTGGFEIVPTQFPRPCSAYELFTQRAIDSRQRAAWRRWIAEGGLNRREIPEALRPHEHAHPVIGNPRRWQRVTTEIQRGLPAAGCNNDLVCDETSRHRSAPVDSGALWNR